MRDAVAIVLFCDRRRLPTSQLKTNDIRYINNGNSFEGARNYLQFLMQRMFRARYKFNRDVIHSINKNSLPFLETVLNFMYFNLRIKTHNLRNGTLIHHSHHHACIAEKKFYIHKMRIAKRKNTVKMFGDLVSIPQTLPTLYLFHV